jgi:hypothetical protein
MAGELLLRRVKVTGHLYWIEKVLGKIWVSHTVLLIKLDFPIYFKVELKIAAFLAFVGNHGGDCQLLSEHSFPLLP